MAKRGTKTLLTDTLLLQIRNEVLKGSETREVAKTLAINENTLYDWKSNNYQKLQDKWNAWETQRMLKQAEKFSDNLMAMSTTNPDGTINKGLVAIQQKESEFLREKLLIARDKYNSGNVVNVNIALPQPIIDLSKVVSTVEQPKSIDK
jgi:hypothetical protein